MLLTYRFSGSFLKGLFFAFFMFFSLGFKSVVCDENDINYKTLSRYPQDLLQFSSKSRQKNYFLQGYFGKSVFRSSQRSRLIASKVFDWAMKYSLNPYLLLSVASVESSFKEGLVSSRDARGIFQIQPETAWWLTKLCGVDLINDSQLHDMDTNIQLGVCYLSWLKYHFKGQVVPTLAAYNMGPSKVEDGRHLRSKSVAQYVQKILVNVGI